MVGGTPSVQVLAQASQDGKWTAHTLELLGDAFLLARRLSGRVGAWVLASQISEAALQSLGHHGCDVVYLLSNDRLKNWASEAVAASLTAWLPEGIRVVLLPGDSRGEEVAAQLCGLAGLEWVSDGLTLSVTRTGSIEIVSTVTGGRLSRACLTRTARPVLVTLREGVAESQVDSTRKKPECLIVPIDLGATPVLTHSLEILPADPKTQDITLARRIVAGGRGTGGETGFARVGELAEALGASVAASRMAVDLGWAPSERQVGQTGKTVRPDLYVACGISGASHHLAGMRDSRHIIAINPDTKAPIHEIAHLSLHCDLNEVIPAIRSRILRRSAGQRGQDPGRNQ